MKSSRKRDEDKGGCMKTQTVLVWYQCRHVAPRYLQYCLSTIRAPRGSLLPQKGSQQTDKEKK